MVPDTLERVSEMMDTPPIQDNCALFINVSQTCRSTKTDSARKI